MSLLPKHYSLVCAVIERDGRIFCVQRPDRGHPATALKWEFPGGKIEEGERAEDAIVREIGEELDMEIRVGATLKVVEHAYPAMGESPAFSLTMTAFHCVATTADFQLLEHKDHRWLRIAELHTLDWAAADLPIVAYLQQIV